jgi:hypothetical protein
VPEYLESPIRLQMFRGNFGYASTRLKQDARLNKMTIVIWGGDAGALP